MVDYSHQVRLSSRMCFAVDKYTFESLCTSWYDPYCFVDPDPKVRYYSESEWNKIRRVNG